jgi:hypothetical protein
MSDFSVTSDVVLDVVMMLDEDWLGLMVKALIEVVVLHETNTLHNTADPNLIF